MDEQYHSVEDRAQLRNSYRRKFGGTWSCTPGPLYSRVGREVAMALTTEAILATNPQLIPTDYGCWLAISQPGSRLRIGVVGETEEDALRQFAAEREAWRRLHEQPSRPTVEADGHA
jgi:hypothetical protein